MVHLLIHLPGQVLLKGPVHYNWMFPIERQLGQYKRSVRNTRYPEGCITEQYVVTECVKYYKLYMDGSNNISSANKDTTYETQFKCSVVSDLVKPNGFFCRESSWISNNLKLLIGASWIITKNQSITLTEPLVVKAIVQINL
ncbi:unnamed protein product [Rhodiola kirilowii]